MLPTTSYTTSNTNPHSPQDNKTPISPIASQEFDSLFSQSKKLKEEANQHLKANKTLALQNYHKALEIFLHSRPKLVTYKQDFKFPWKISLSPDHQKLVLEHFAATFSNCSFIYIENKNPLMALYYAKLSLWSNENFFKAHLRIAKALIDLLYLHEAQQLLNSLKQLPEQSKAFETEISALLNEASQLLTHYSSPAMIIKFLSGDLSSSWSEEKAYVGPIEEFVSPESGRGYRAIRDLAKGEVILIEKGFVFGQKKADFCYHLITKLNQREDLKALYMNLYPCPQYPLSKELQGSIQGRMREHTLKSLFNAYRKDHPVSWENFEEAEINELLAKAQYDAFQVNGTPALFPHLSALNHSCNPNTSVWYAKDKVLVLARRNIAKNEEICVSYAPVATDRIQRRAKLSFYGFECKCERCEEQGEWKEKAARVNGLRCPKCRKEIAVDHNKMFVCPEGCWEGDYSFFEFADQELKEQLVEIEGIKDNNDEKLKRLSELLETVDQRFSYYHNNRALVLHLLAKCCAKKGDREAFMEWFLGIVEMIEYYPTLELRVILNDLLIEIVASFGRGLSDEELGVFRNYGLMLDVTKSLWEKFINGDKSQGWFLPFEINNKISPDDDNK